MPRYRDLIALALICAAVLLAVINSGCSRVPPPAQPEPVTMADTLVCFHARAEQTGTSTICAESVLMCEAIRAEEYDRGAEVGDCKKALVALDVKE